MSINRVRQIYVGLVGLTIMAALFPLAGALRDGPRSDISIGDQMILGIYLPFGIFLLLASRRPAAHRSLILAIGWSGITHTTVMVIQSLYADTLRQDAVSLLVFGLVGLGLILLAPPREPRGDSRAAVASTGPAA